MTDNLRPKASRKAPAADDTPKHRSKKNTKLWCKGKVGRPHTPSEPVNRNIYPCQALKWGTFGRDGIEEPCGWHWSCKHEVVCLECGKILEWLLPKERCPDYVEEEK